MSSADIDRDSDSQDLENFGYKPRLHRSIGSFTSFALGFSMVSITAAIFTTFSSPFQTIGGAGIWLWIPITIGFLPLLCVYAHLSARIPISGYAYQWCGRIVNRHYGALTGWMAAMAFVAGAGTLGLAVANVFSPYVWANPTHHDIELFATVILVIGVLLNVIGVRIATWVNNVGASVELVGTFGLTIALGIALAFVHHKQGFHVLFSTHHLGGGSGVTIVGLALAALLPVYTLIGWEGCADLAEETIDPRRVAPKAMLRSVLISAIGGFLVFGIIAMAIPGTVSATFAQSSDPIIYIFKSQLGSFAGDLIGVVAFCAMFSALIANIAVATRLIFSLGRDNMLPASKFFANVNPKTQTPINVTVVVGLIGVLLAFVSGGIVDAVAAVVSAAYYGTYLLTMFAVIWAVPHNRIPEPPKPGYFSLGKWLVPLAWMGALFSLVIIGAETLPSVNHIAAKYTGIGLLLGLVWYVTVLRRRLLTGRAGIALDETIVQVDGRNQLEPETDLSL